MIKRAQYRLFVLAGALSLAPGLALAQGLAVGVGAGAGAGVGVSIGSSPTIGSPAAPSVSTGSKDVTEALTAAGSAGGQTAIEQQQALDAVKEKRALPLEQIVARAHKQSDGEILDAKLVSIRGFLLYQLKILAADGDITEVYYYAQSGNMVRIK
jgi:hypothetical protein